MRARLVLTVVWEQPAYFNQDWTTRPHGYYRSIEQLRNKVEKRRSTPPCCCCTVRGVERDKGMGPSYPNGPSSHPIGDLHQRNLNCNLSVIHPSPFPECKKRDSPTRRLRPNLHRSQYLLSHLILPSPTSITHPGDTRVRRTNRIIAAPQPYLIHRSHKLL